VVIAIIAINDDVINAYAIVNESNDVYWINATITISNRTGTNEWGDALNVKLIYDSIIITNA
jgi:hypothetical protein